MIKIWMFLGCLLPMVSRSDEALAGKVVAPVADVFVENRFIQVGINLKLGGAITHVSEPGGPNRINSFDLGRQIQQSYYSGPANYQRGGKRKSPGWAEFPWNPIQTGDVYRNGSKVLDHHVANGELYVKTQPMLWPMENDPGECVMETWIQLSQDSPKFEYRARLTNSRSDKTQYGPHPQEVPAIYVNGPWHHLMSYAGDHPFSGGAVVELRNDHHEPWPWVRFVGTEGWAALVNDAGSGFGVCVPKVTEFHGGFAGIRGSGDERSNNTGYMAPIANEILDFNIIYEYSCTMILGNLEQIRAEAARVVSKKLPAWNFEPARCGWHYQNGRDTGWSLSGKGLTVKASATQPPLRPGGAMATQVQGAPILWPVRLIGPITFWRALAAGQVAVRISSGTAGTMRVFWCGMPPFVAVDNSTWNEWRKNCWTTEHSVKIKIPAGNEQWVTAPLAGLPDYQGEMTGLAMDVPDGVTIHEVRLLAAEEKRPQ